MTKRYGMCYMGSKSQIAPQLVDYMLNRHPEKNIFIDCCCGGFAISHYILENYKSVRVIANDFNSALMGLYDTLFNKPDEFIKAKEEIQYNFVDRDTYNECLDKNDVKSVLTKYCYSFGGQPTKHYLFGRDIELQKELLSNLLVYGNDYKKKNELLFDLIDAVNL